MRMFPWSRKRGSTGAGSPTLPIADYLRKVDIFQDLSREETEDLFKGIVLKECAPGTVFFAPEDSSERVFILKLGLVEVYRITAQGKRLVTRRIGPGTIFGEMGLLGQTLQGCFAEATESSLVCVATKDDILQLLRERPDIAIRLLDSIGNRLKSLEDRLEDAVFSPVKVRLARFLLSSLGPAASNAVSGYTHAEIGDVIGALRQTVTEILSDLEGQGLVEVGRKQIRVINRPALEEIAQGEG
jgi:CRP/FNR family transcriptional regulator, cyclic AMP receptor protein